MRAETLVDKTLEIELPQNRVPPWVMPLVVASVMAVDVVFVTACFLLAFVIREGRPVLEPGWSWSREFGPYVAVLFFTVPVWIAMLAYRQVYRFHGAFSYAQEAINIFKAVSVGALLSVAWAFLFRGGYLYRDFAYSRGVFFLDFLLALAVLLVFHLSLRYAQTLFRERGINLIPTLVVGGDEEVGVTVNELAERRYLGYRVIGIVRSGTDDLVLGTADAHGTPVVGGIDDLADLIGKFHIQEVIITDNSIERERLFQAMMQIGRGQRVEFRFAPSLLNMLPQKTSVEQIGVLPMVRLFREPLSDGQRFLKRVSDIVIAVAATLLTLPIWLAAAIAVKLDGTAGPVLFSQERVGMDGRVFLCYKFRTMIAGAGDEAHRAAARKNIEGNAAANAGDEDQPIFGKVRDDPRITRTGRFLRRSSIDELPQLINVFRGEMSVVGPRPPIPYEVVDYGATHRKRLDMRPGLTGLWQVSGRNRLTFEEMVRVDLYYIENWSVLLDLKIIFLTIPAVLRGDGAR